MEHKFSNSPVELIEHLYKEKGAFEGFVYCDYTPHSQSLAYKSRQLPLTSEHDTRQCITAALAFISAQPQIASELGEQPRRLIACYGQASKDFLQSLNVPMMKDVSGIEWNARRGANSSRVLVMESRLGLHCSVCFLMKQKYVGAVAGMSPYDAWHAYKTILSRSKVIIYNGLLSGLTDYAVYTGSFYIHQIPISNSMDPQTVSGALLMNYYCLDRRCVDSSC